MIEILIDSYSINYCCLNMQELIIDNFFKYLRDYSYYSYGSVIVGICFCTFLKIGDTLASFHSDGNIPVRIDSLNICVNEGETMSSANFRSLLGILSKAVAFLASSFFKSLHTLFTLVFCKENTLSVGVT